MSEPTYLLTESELTRIMAACWASGKANEFPFALDSDSERLVLGAVVVSSRDGYSDLSTRRAALLGAVIAGRASWEEWRVFVKEFRRNPIAYAAGMLLGAFEEVKQ